MLDLLFIVIGLYLIFRQANSDLSKRFVKTIPDVVSGLILIAPTIITTINKIIPIGWVIILLSYISIAAYIFSIASVLHFIVFYPKFSPKNSKYSKKVLYFKYFIITTVTVVMMWLIFTFVSKH